MSMTLTLLGTGTSSGVPMIGCTCEVCTSTDPRDHRDRPGAMLQYPLSPRERVVESSRPGEGTSTLGGTLHSNFEFRSSNLARHHTVLIDTTPELRQQMIRHRVMEIAGVVYTHNHADHIFGIDDLRRFNAVMGKRIDIYAEQYVIDHLHRSFPHIFEPHKNLNDSFIPQLTPHVIEPDRGFELGGMTWLPLRLMHGRQPILGFRVGNVAYCTDVSSIPPETYPHLYDLDVLVIDALRYRHHPTHLTVDQALQIIDELKPRRAYLTHIAHEIKHADLEPKLPPGVFLGYDGLAISITPI